MGIKSLNHTKIYTNHNFQQIQVFYPPEIPPQNHRWTPTIQTPLLQWSVPHRQCHAQFPRRCRIHRPPASGYLGMDGWMDRLYYDHMGVEPKIGVVLPPKLYILIGFSWLFHYKPSILGQPYFWKHPYMYESTMLEKTDALFPFILEPSCSCFFDGNQRRFQLAFFLWFLIFLLLAEHFFIAKILQSRFGWIFFRIFGRFIPWTHVLYGN